MKFTSSTSTSGEQTKAIEFYQPLNYKPETTVGYMLRNVHISLLKMIDIEMQKHDLTAMQWRPLLFIYVGKVDTAAALAKETDMDTGATTRMLDRLQNKGLLIRNRSEQDRRVVHLALTEEGQKICEKIPADLCKVVNHHLRGFSQQEHDLLKDFLGRMLANGMNT